MPREYPTLLDLVGGTPIVRLDRIARRRRADAAREARVPEPGRLEQGPDRARDDRGRRTGGQAASRRDDRRADFGQHRRRPRDRRRRTRLPLHLRHARQDEPGEDLDAAGLRRRGRDHADRGGARLARELLLGLRPARGGDPGRLQARPVLEHGEPAGPLRDDGAGDLGADRRRDRRTRDLGRHGRDDLGRRPLPEGAQPGDPDRRRRPGGLGLHVRGDAPISRRGHRQGYVARDDVPRRRRSLGARLRPRLVRDRAAALARGGDPRRRLGGDDDLGRARGGEGLRPGRADPDDPARLRPLLPLQVLRRQLDAPVRVPRAEGARAHDRRGAALQARRGARGARPRHDRVARKSRRRNRPDAALLDLAAAGRPQRAGGVARGRRRLAAGARRARPGLQEPGRDERGRSRDDAAAAGGGRRRRLTRSGLRRPLRPERGGRRRRGRPARRRSSHGPICWSTSHISDPR